MKIPDNSSEGYELIPAGLHPAICILSAGIGPKEVEYKGEKKIQEKMMIGFEIPSIRREYEKDGVKQSSPAQISNRFTASMSERSNLRKSLVAWRGREFTADEIATFETKDIVGAACQILIQHVEKDGKTYANITNYLPYEGEKLTAESDLVDYDPTEHDQVMFEKLHPWIQKLVTLPDGSKPYKEPESTPESTGSTGHIEETEDVPF